MHWWSLGGLNAELKKVGDGVLALSKLPQYKEPHMQKHMVK